MKISAVTFDVGGTLIEPWPSVGHVYAAVAARHGVKNLSAEMLAARFAAAWGAQNNFRYTRAAWAALVDLIFKGLCDEPPRETFFSELYDHFAEPAAWRMFDDVLPTLKALAANGTRLGIISNWDERLRILLARLHLDKYFEKIIISCEVGFPKPSPIIFGHAAKTFGLSPNSILHVGDSSALDVAGAKSAGFRAVRIQRDEHSTAGEQINSLSLVPAMIATALDL